MPRFQVGFVSRVWIETEVIAPNREAAEEKAQRNINKHMNSNGFYCIDGQSEHCQTTNLSLLNKLPEIS